MLFTHFQSVVPETGIEPVRLAARDFKSLVSTCSTTWAWSRTLPQQQARCTAGQRGSPTRLFQYAMDPGLFGRSAGFALLSLDAADRLDRQTQPALVIGFDDLEADDLTDLEHIVDVGDAVVGDLGNVQQAIATRQHLHDGTKVEQAQHRTFVLFAHFDVGREFLDATLGFASLVEVGTRDRDAAVVADIDLCARFFGQCTDRGAALADDVADLLRIDLEGQHARCELGQLGTRTFDRGTHGFEDVQTAFASLAQRHLHDFLGDALDLDIHLQSSDALDGTRHLEVHVAQVIFVAQNVGKYGELATVHDQAHGHAGHVIGDRHAGVHHGQAATADRCHRRGPVGLSDFGHDTNRVLEFFGRRQQ